MTGTFTNQWVYVAAPMIGTLLAVLTTRVLHPERNEGEVRSASGDG